MLNRSASLAMSTSVLKALPGKLDAERCQQAFSKPCLVNLISKHAKDTHLVFFISVFRITGLNILGMVDTHFFLKKNIILCIKVFTYSSENLKKF